LNFFCPLSASKILPRPVEASLHLTAVLPAMPLIPLAVVVLAMVVPAMPLSQPIRLPSRPALAGRALPAFMRACYSCSSLL
jgi:hypothetical protein